MTDAVQAFLESGGKSMPRAKAVDAVAEDTNDPVQKFLASGGASLPKSVAPEKKQSQGYALPDTGEGRLVAGVLGEVKGAYDTVVAGPAQLLGKTFGGDVSLTGRPMSEVRQEREESFKDVTRNVPQSAAIGEFTGNVVGGMALPQLKAIEGANWFNRAIAAATTGGLFGLASKVDDEANYWSEKAQQIVLGGLAAFFANPLGEGLGKTISASANKLAGLGRRVMNWADGNADEAVEAAIKDASPELQQAIRARAKSGLKMDPKEDAGLARQLEADSLPIKMQLTEGQAIQDAAKISTELNTRSKNPAMQQRMADHNRQLRENLNHVRDTGAPDANVTDHITAGENLIKSGETIIAKKAQETSALYKQLTDANGGSLPIDGKAFVESAEAALKKNLKSHFLPAEVRSTLNEIKDSGQMNFEQFESLRTILATEARSNTSGNARAAAATVRDALENVEVGSEVKGIKELADAARKSAREGFKMLEDNPALEAIASGKAKDNNFVQKYIIGSSKKELTTLGETLKDDPVALQTIKAGVVNYLKKAAGVVDDQGNFSQSGYNKALSALGPKLDIMFGPDEAHILKTVGNVARYVQLAPKGAYVNTSNTDVANLARQGAANVVDRFTMVPIGTMAKNALEESRGATRIADMIGPGAGIGKENPTLRKIREKLPKALGRAATVPIAVAAEKARHERSDY